MSRVVHALPQGKGLPAGDWERRHRGLLAILWLHVVGIPAFGVAQGYSVGHSLLEGSLLLAAALFAQFARVGHRARSGAVSLGLLTASGLLVHFSGGFIEFHFHFFVMIALLSLYVDWVPFLLAVGYVLFHHGLLGVLDPQSVYNHADGIAHPWKWAAVHAAFVLGAGAANVFTWRITEEETRRRRNVEQVTEAALAKLPLDRLLDELLVRISGAIEAETAAIWLKEEDGLVLRAAHGGEPPERRIALSLDDGFHAGIVARAMPAVMEGDADLVALDSIHRVAGVRALAGVPLVVEGELIGVLDVANSRPRQFKPSDLDLLQLVADRVAPAIDRARLYEQEHRIATTLQRRLLPNRLPDLPRVELAARYVPAGEAVAVGGDWYDAIKLPGGHVALVMGDVAGHGTEAASLMGQLSTALRAYANEGHPPGDVVRRLNEFLHSLEDDNMATLLYLEIDAEAGTGWMVNAGHPPPLLLRAGGEPEYIEGERSVPLGVSPQIAYRASEVAIDPGSTLVLYTDGLIERRGSVLDVGFEALCSRLARAAPASAEAICADVVSLGLGDRLLADDIAVLVMQTLGAPIQSFRAEHPAEPAAVAVVRRKLEHLLRSLDASPEEIYDVALSCGEACTNAVQHAYGADGGTFTVAARVHDGEVSIDISDNGEWRPPRPSDKGRGLSLMRALMDNVHVEQSPLGTCVTLRRALRGTPAVVDLAP